MRNGLLLIGTELTPMVELSIRLRSLSRNVTIQDSPRPLAAALLEDLSERLAAIIYLTGIENVADLRAVMTANPGTTFLFLTKQSPPRAPLTHAINSCGGKLLQQSESTVVIAATLVAMMSTSSASA